MTIAIPQTFNPRWSEADNAEEQARIQAGITDATEDIALVGRAVLQMFYLLRRSFTIPQLIACMPKGTDVPIPKVLARLEADGYVEKSPPETGKDWHYSLTDDGTERVNAN